MSGRKDHMIRKALAILFVAAISLLFGLMVVVWLASMLRLQ